MNQTACSQFEGTPVCFTSKEMPLYYNPQRTLVDGIADPILTLAAPILAYWSSSLVFHYLDTCGWKWLDQYRLHESAEVKTKNLVTRSQVVWAVIFQQVVQTLLGLFWLSEKNSGNTMLGLQDTATRIGPVLETLLGKEQGVKLLHDAAYFVYWWGIPSAQLLMAMFIIDTWQYFLHRSMHVNKWLYRHFHSWHHRLYVPYAFGALYNHPVEGFVLDSMGAALAEYLTGMTSRQALVLFVISTFKTVDDHCGYKFPFDPLQLMSGNNAAYHDIHHQVIGIKSNFAQPFFIHWDVLLGTRMTREEMESRKRRQKSS